MIIRILLGTTTPPRRRLRLEGKVGQAPSMVEFLQVLSFDSRCFAGGACWEQIGRRRVLENVQQDHMFRKSILLLKDGGRICRFYPKMTIQHIRDASRLLRTSDVINDLPFEMLWENTNPSRGLDEH